MHLIVRSLSTKIGTQWTKAPNLVQLFLNTYKIISEGEEDRVTLNLGVNLIVLFYVPVRVREILNL